MLLNRLRRLHKPIRLGVVGIGAMGKGLVYQALATPNMDCIAIADIRIERAIACAQWLQKPYRIVNTEAEAHEAIAAGRMAVCEDGNLVARCPDVDVFVEASSSILPAVQFSMTAIEHGKHLVLMNAEIDLIFGPYLLQLAREHDVVYTSCDGDQHGVLKRLADDIQLWGFDLVMLGNIKGFLDRTSNPTRIIPEADKRNLDYRMAAAYTDGTKLAIEMALAANSMGLCTHVPGMYGPRASHVSDVFHLFDLEALWRQRVPLVDYILGAEPGGGVFAVGYCTNSYQQDMLKYYKMGQGPFYLFYRPYHLCHVEAMQCIAEAYLDHCSLLEPTHGLRTNVIAYAKYPLQQGQTLDGIGGYCCYGLIENYGETAPGLPICLAEDVRLKRPVGQDERISWDDVEFDPARLDFTLYARTIAASNGFVR